MLDEWYGLRSNAACTIVLDIVEHKYKLDSLADSLRTNLYFSSESTGLAESCRNFEYALIDYKNKVYQDLISGIKKGKQ